MEYQQIFKNKNLLRLYRPAPAGSHQVVWDGTDSRGQAAASGVYAYRLTAGTHVATRKLLLMK
ncbi:MAG: hypothetical protein Kow0042_08970 [Calditrichia bacterium]